MRIQVNANEQMLAKIDKYAELMAVSRSALCSMLIGQGLMGLDKSYGILSDIGERLGDALIAEKTMAEMGKTSHED